MNRKLYAWVVVGAVVAVLGIAARARAGGGGGQANGAHYMFMKSAVEDADLAHVTLPLYQGTTAAGVTVWYVITDASSRDVAARLGVNYAPKLANTAGTFTQADIDAGLIPAAAATAVCHLGGRRGSQRAHGAPESLVFDATVDFTPHRCLSAGSDHDGAGSDCTTQTTFNLPLGAGSGGVCYRPGAVGQSGYSPLVELDDGTVLNASHIANSLSGDHADKAVINGNGTVTIEETQGFSVGRAVHYISLDGGSPIGAVVENVTFATLMSCITRGVNGSALENSGHDSGRAGIIAFINGQQGIDDTAIYNQSVSPNRQGVNSLILDRPTASTSLASGGSCVEDTQTRPVPRNILQFIPRGQDDPAFPLYSPMWDTHFPRWKSSVLRADRLIQTDFDAVLANTAQIINFNGDPTVHTDGAGAVGNCPIVSMDPDK